jgi:hypothetical protein
MVAPTTVVLAVAVIVTGAGEPRTVEAAVAGDVRATVGKVVDVTTTVIAALVTVVPLASVTRAVSVVTPATVGVHVVENGAVSEVPTMVVPTRKSTRVTVTPPRAEAVAVNGVAVPNAIATPLAWLVRATVGTEAATVTLTGVDVVAAPLESVTLAVSEAGPFAVGVQLTM